MQAPSYVSLTPAKRVLREWRICDFMVRIPLSLSFFSKVGINTQMCGITIDMEASLAEIEQVILQCDLIGQHIFSLILTGK